MFSALLDTCVLWPSLQRDFVLSMAVEGPYRPLWSEAILEELKRHEELKWFKRGKEPADSRNRADRLIHLMRTHFDDALVTGWEPLEGTFALPDPDDEHVVAAAVIGGAGAIVTENFKDIRRGLVPSHIDLLSVQEFAANTADVDPTRAAKVLHELSQRHTEPARTPEQLLEVLVDRYKMTDVAEIIRPALCGGP
ncbi:PIN domain-containing protein [Angustibacter sp. McL0619]|uniref:PIN domain-containing protein n=1 Tax=Angustibacter sp. McL0619 TaxID=3415676 RepID=UPI003CF73B6B